MSEKNSPHRNFSSELNLTDEAAMQAQLALNSKFPHKDKDPLLLAKEEEDENPPEPDPRSNLWRGAHC